MVQNLKAKYQKIYAFFDILLLWFRNLFYFWISDLKERSSKLKVGASNLADGTKTLADGIAEFNETGIQKLVAIFDSDIELLIDRLSAMTPSDNCVSPSFRESVPSERVFKPAFKEVIPSNTVFVPAEREVIPSFNPFPPSVILAAICFWPVIVTSK